MMKIKIKVRNLLLFLLLLACFCFTFIYLLLPGYYYYVAKKAVDNDQADQSQKVERVMDYPWAINVYKKNIMQYTTLSGQLNKSYDVLVGPSLIEWHENSLQLDDQKEIAYLKWYIEHAPIDGYYEQAMTQIVNLYHRYRHDKAIEEAFEIAFDRQTSGSNKIHMQALKLQYAHEKIIKEDFEAGEELLESLLSEDIYYDFEGRVNLARADLALTSGDFKKAQSIINLAYETYQKEAKLAMETSDEIEGISVVYDQLRQMKRAIEHHQEMSQVSGSIRKSDGRPMSHVGVFLREEKDINQSVQAEEAFQTETDENGFYQLDHIPEGKYQMTLGLDYDQVDGWVWPNDLEDWIHVTDQPKQADIVFQPLIDIKEPGNQVALKEDMIQFSWEPVQDAAYYQIEFTVPIENGSIGTLYPERFTETTQEISRESLYLHEVSRFFPDDNLDEYDSSTLLGLMHPEKTFTWAVNAYDDNDRLMTTSKGYRLKEENIGTVPIFQLKARQLNEADRALISGDFDQALNLYLENYQANPEDLPSLIMITRLINGRDPSLWADYMTALVKLTDNQHIKSILDEERKE